MIRDGAKTIEYSPQLGNPLEEYTKQLTGRFESGIGESYDKTPLRNGFLTAEVNDIENPALRKTVSFFFGIGLSSIRSYAVK